MPNDFQVVHTETMMDGEMVVDTLPDGRVKSNKFRE